MRTRIAGFALNTARSAAMSLARSNMASPSSPSVLVPVRK